MVKPITPADLADLEIRLFDRISHTIDQVAELAALRVLDTHFKYCRDQRSRKWTAVLSVLGVLTAIAGTYLGVYK
jgi:endonuclease/exonuclease/phosphatase family metal-dependent hydrolase